MNYPANLANDEVQLDREGFFMHTLRVVRETRVKWFAVLPWVCVATSCVGSGSDRQELVGSVAQAVTPAETSSRVLGFEGTIGGAGSDAGLQRVADGNQFLGEALDGELARIVDFALGALAVVLQLGDRP